MILSAHPDRHSLRAGSRCAGDIARVTTAALLIRAAKAVEDLATKARLTDVDPRQCPGAAVAAAATAASVTKNAVVRTAARSRGLDVLAGAQRGSLSLRAESTAAIGVARAGVAGLDAERRTEHALALHAQPGAATRARGAVGLRVTRVARGEAGGVQRHTLVAGAVLTAALGRRRASLIVGGAARRAGADPARSVALKIAAVGRHLARASRPLQVVTDDLHLPLTESQMFEQHWPLLVHASPATVQMTPVPPEPGVPTSLGPSPRLASPEPRPALWVEQASSVRAHIRIATSTVDKRALEVIISSPCTRDRGVVAQRTCVDRPLDTLEPCARHDSLPGHRHSLSINERPARRNHCRRLFGVAGAQPEGLP